jgi:hypothetical protein
MPKMKNLAALAAAVQAGRSYARNNPDKAGRYVDQAAAFLDKQTKGRYSGQIGGVVDKVKNAAGLPRTSPGAQGFEANAGYGTTSGRTTPVTPSTTTPTTPSSTTVPPVTVTTPTTPTVRPERTGDRPFPGSRDV